MKEVNNKLSRKLVFSIILLAILPFFSINNKKGQFMFASENKASFLGSGTVFKLNPITDGILAGSSLTLIGTSLILNKCTNIKTPYIWGQYMDINSVNSFDSLLMFGYSSKLNTVANIFEVTSLLSASILLTTGLNEWFTIGTMYAETMLLAYGSKELAKAVVNRPRPYMYSYNVSIDGIMNGDWNCSFFSGHTTMAFASAAFTSFVFCKYNPDSFWKIPVIACSYALAITTASLRIAGGCHYLSDVLVGIVAGSITGFGVPLLHTIGLNSDIALGRNKSMKFDVIPNGALVSFKF